MTTDERIAALARAGLSREAIAAILDTDEATIALARVLPGSAEPATVVRAGGSTSVPSSVATRLDAIEAALALPGGGGGTPPTIIELPFSAIGDAGLVDWLGTHDANGNTRVFQNPSLDASALVPTASAGLYGGYPIQNATDKGASIRPALVQTNPVGAWMRWQIGDGSGKRKLKPNHYALHGNDEAGSAQLRNWKLQGSNDGVAWTDLDTRTGNTAINQGAPAHFAIADPGQSFAYFRLFQTGANSDGTDWLAVGEIELYGQLEIAAPA